MNSCSSLPAHFAPVSSLKFLLRSHSFSQRLSSPLRSCHTKAEHPTQELQLFIPEAFNLPRICPNILGIIAHPSLIFLPRYGKCKYSKIYPQIHSDAALCQLYTCPQSGVTTFRYLQAGSLTLTAWLLGSWSLLRWVLSCFSCPASAISHQPPLSVYSSPTTFARSWSKDVTCVNSSAPAEAELVAEEFAKLHCDPKSVLLHRLCSLHPETQSIRETLAHGRGLTVEGH